MKFLRRWKRSAPPAASSPPPPLAPSQDSSVPDGSGVAPSSGPATVRVSVHSGTGWDDSEVVPAEVRTRGMMPDAFGLYPHELLMLSYAPTFATDHTDFQGFWWWQYGVQNPRELLVSLTDRGFVETGGPEQAVARQTAASLKDLLRTRGLKLGGNKAEIVERVLASVPHETINKAFPQRWYVRTQAGEEALASSEHIDYIHRRRDLDGLDIYTLSALRAEYPQHQWRDLVWGHLNQMSLQHAQAGNFGFYRNTKFNMAKFCAEERRHRDALGLITEVIYCDLSGIGNGFTRDRPTPDVEYLFPYDLSLATVPPGVTDLAFKWAAAGGVEDAELHSLLADRLSQLSMPFHLFSKDEVLQIIFLERAKDITALSALYEQAERRFRQASERGPGGQSYN